MEKLLQKEAPEVLFLQTSYPTSLFVIGGNPVTVATASESFSLNDF